MTSVESDQGAITISVAHHEVERLIRLAADSAARSEEQSRTFEDQARRMPAGEGRDLLTAAGIDQAADGALARSLARRLEEAVEARGD